MSDNKLKIDVVLADVGESGAVLSDFVTQEIHNTDMAKKADLVNGKVNPTQLPEFAELSGATDVFSQLENNLRENINTSLTDSKAYADSIVSEVMSKKADLVNGRVPKEQATNFKDIPGAKAAIDGLKQSLGQEIIGINDSLENNFAKLTNGKVSQTVLPSDLVYSDRLTREMDDVFSEWIKIENPISPLKNKKWLAIGDSITVGYGSNNKSYADILATKHNAILTKLASSGSTINGGINMPDNQTLSKLIDSLTSDQNFDLITIAAGTNDPFDRAFGVFEDRTRDTFYGSLHYMMIQLKSKFPNARMLFISQIPRVNLRSLHDKTSALDIKFKAISEVCDYYSVPIFVGHRNFGFHPDDNTEFKNKYMPDGLHPSDAGQVWFANRVEQAILSCAK